jgi:2-methylisocitrate lyase-like PEP mutase family enzyme
VRADFRQPSPSAAAEDEAVDITEKARMLRALHERDVLVLPNAGDPVSAALVARAMIAAGAVGVNIEDSRAEIGTLREAGEQAERVQAAREAAGLPDFVISVRTDVFLFQIGEPAGRLDDVLARVAAYAEAGADCLFVPGLLDLDLNELLESAA